jgi:hypothetical protein
MACGDDRDFLRRSRHLRGRVLAAAAERRERGAKRRRKQ